jgi:hypothetical protein
MRFRYEPLRPKFDVVTAIELGDLDRGYHAIDITGTDELLYSLSCPLYLGLIAVAIPKYTKGLLALVPKNQAGQTLTSRVEALDDPRKHSPYLLPPPGAVDKNSVAIGAGNGGLREIKEWQAIMDHSGVCRLRATANCRQSQSMNVLWRSGLSRQADQLWVGPRSHVGQLWVEAKVEKISMRGTE